MTNTNPLQTAWGLIPHFQSSSIPRTIDFYTKHLHFKLGGTYPDDAEIPSFCSVYSGAVPAIRANIYFFLQEEGKEISPSTAAIALGTLAVDQYYEMLRDEGIVEILDHVENKPWGYRQFTIRDPDGNKLQFFRFIEGGNPGDG